MIVDLKPRFDANKGIVAFDANELNVLAEEQYNDKFGFFQENFGTYTYMKYVNQLGYKIHYPQGTPLMWQAHNSCAWTPTGTLDFGSRTITPTRAKVNEQFCYDEFLDSAYKAFLQWGGSVVNMSTEGQKAVELLARTVIKNMTLGGRTSMVAGQLYDLSSVEYADGVPSRISDAFSRTADVVQGWIALAIQTATETGKEHLDTTAIASGDISADGKTYTGNVLTLFDAMVNGAPAPLQNAITEGGIGGFGSVYQTIWKVSPSIHKAVYSAWQTQSATAAVNRPRITRREYTVNTANGTRPIYVYFIDDVAVIPVHETAVFEQYLTGTSHFAYLTISGTIQLGGSFAAIPRPDNAPVGVLMQVSENVEDYGTHKFLSHALFATAINDTDFITGSYAYATPS